MAHRSSQSTSSSNSKMVGVSKKQGYISPNHLFFNEAFPWEKTIHFGVFSPYFLETLPYLKKNKLQYP